MDNCEISIITAPRLSCLTIRVTPDQEISDLLTFPREELQEGSWQVRG